MLQQHLSVWVWCIHSPDHSLSKQLISIMSILWSETCHTRLITLVSWILIRPYVWPTIVWLLYLHWMLEIIFVNMVVVSTTADAATSLAVIQSFIRSVHLGVLVKYSSHWVKHVFCLFSARLVVFFGCIHLLSFPSCRPIF